MARTGWRLGVLMAGCGFRCERHMTMRKERIISLYFVAPAGRLIAAGKKMLEIRRCLPDIAPDDALLIVVNRLYFLI